MYDGRRSHKSIQNFYWKPWSGRDHLPERITNCKGVELGCKPLGEWTGSKTGSSGDCWNLGFHNNRKFFILLYFITVVPFYSLSFTFFPYSLCLFHRFPLIFLEYLSTVVASSSVAQNATVGDLAVPLLHFNSFSSRKLDFIPLSYEVERTSKIVYSLDLVIGVLLVDRLCTAKFFRAQHQLREKLVKARHRVCPSWWLKTQRTISKKRKDS